MTKKFVTRALLIAGLIVAGTSATFAQAQVSKVRRVAHNKVDQQPVAQSSVIAENQAITLSADQRSQIAAMNQEVAALHAERARLWAEYRALQARPDFTDEMAAAEAAPRMQRIVAINEQLAPIVARQDSKINSILSSSQRAQVASMVSLAKTRF